MRKSTEAEKFGVLIGKLDLLCTKKNKFITEAKALNLKILRSTKLSCYQKSDFIREITLKADNYEFSIN